MRIVPRTVFVIILLSFHLIRGAKPVAAEIYECSGVVTNRPCDGGTALLTEKPYAPPSPEEADEKDKRSLIEGLRRLSINVKSNYGFELEVAPVEVQCRTSTLKECGKLVADAQEKMNLLVAQSKSQGSSGGITAAGNSTQPGKESPPGTRGSDSHTIINVTPPIIIRRPYYPNLRPRTPSFPPPPFATPPFATPPVQPTYSMPSGRRQSDLPVGEPGHVVVPSERNHDSSAPLF